MIEVLFQQVVMGLAKLRDVIEIVVPFMGPVIWFGLFLWAGNIILKELFGAFRMIRRLFVEVPLRYRCRKFRERVRAVGCIVVYNEESEIQAVSSRDSLEFKLSLQRQHHTNRAERLRALPDYTYTFSDPDRGLDIVTGTKRDMGQLLDALIAKVTGYRMDQVTESTWNYGARVICRRDRRLVVPFVKSGMLSSGQTMPSMEEQITKFGGKTLDEARSYFFTLAWAASEKVKE